MPTEIRTMTEAEASRHEGRIVEVHAATPPAPDAADGRRTALATPLDERDRIHGELIAAAIARDADHRLADLTAGARTARARLERDEAELAEATKADAHAAADADAFDAACGGRAPAPKRLATLGTIVVLGVLAVAEAALNYPGFKYALPAPAAPGLIGVVLPLMPAIAALAVGLGCAVAQKVVGSELAAAHRGLIGEPASPDDPYAA